MTLQKIKESIDNRRPILHYIRELAIAGLLAAVAMYGLGAVAKSDDAMRTARRTETVSTPAVPTEAMPSEGAADTASEAETQPAAPIEPAVSLAKEPGQGLDPIAEPDYFDIMDAIDEFSLVVSHVPSQTLSLPDRSTARTEPSQKSRIVIDKLGFTLTLFDGGEFVRQYAVAVGKSHGNKSRAGDMRTPEGTFAITRIHDSHNWVHDFGDGNGVIAGAYGPLFIRLATAPWSGIGIHGTHDPDSIGTNATEGCVRMRNEDLIELSRLIDEDTTVTILPN